MQVTIHYITWHHSVDTIHPHLPLSMARMGSRILILTIQLTKAPDVDGVAAAVQSRPPDCISQPVHRAARGWSRDDEIDAWVSRGCVSHSPLLDQMHAKCTMQMHPPGPRKSPIGKCWTGLLGPIRKLAGPPTTPMLYRTRIGASFRSYYCTVHVRSTVLLPWYGMGWDRMRWDGDGDGDGRTGLDWMETDWM